MLNYICQKNVGLTLINILQNLLCNNYFNPVLLLNDSFLLFLTNMNIISNLVDQLNNVRN